MLKYFQNILMKNASIEYEIPSFNFKFYKVNTTEVSGKIYNKNKNKSQTKTIEEIISVSTEALSKCRGSWRTVGLPAVIPVTWVMLQLGFWNILRHMNTA